MLCWCNTSFHRVVEKTENFLQDLEQSQSDFKYEATMVRISALGWSSDLRNLTEMNFIQLNDYPVVSREYHHIVWRGTHYRKYHRNCSVWLRKRGKGCSPPGRGDLLLLLLLMWYLLLYHILQLKLFPFCLPRCILDCHLITRLPVNKTQRSWELGKWSITKEALIVIQILLSRTLRNV